MEPRWLTRHMVIAIHGEAVTLFGGAAGLRDRELLENALERPRNPYAYGNKPGLYELAAAYCYGIIVRAHPFMDGNKRTGLLAARTFLFLNGYHFEPEQADEVRMMVAVADGTADEALLAGWFRDYSTRKED